MGRSSLTRTDPIIENLVVARKALLEASTLPQAKQLHSLAAAAEVYARQQGLSEDSIGFAHQVKTEALARLGEILAGAPKNTGAIGAAGPGRKKRGVRQTPRFLSDIPTYKDLDIKPHVAKTAQKLAALAPTELNAVAARDKTLAAIQREKKAVELERRIALPDAKFRVVYADPPWAYNDKADAGAVQGKGAGHHYPTMSIQALCELPVKEICDPDAVLFLWVTSPLLAECFPVIEAWGFSYRACFVWDKVKHNMGHYNSVRHEFLLICGRGSCAPKNPTLYDSVQVIQRTGHSEKPEAFRAIIDSLYSGGRRIELFARQAPQPPWQSWGNEVDEPTGSQRAAAPGKAG